MKKFLNDAIAITGATGATVFTFWALDKLGDVIQHDSTAETMMKSIPPLTWLTAILYICENHNLGLKKAAIAALTLMK